MASSQRLHRSTSQVLRAKLSDTVYMDFSHVEIVFATGYVYCYVIYPADWNSSCIGVTVPSYVTKVDDVIRWLFIGKLNDIQCALKNIKHREIHYSYYYLGFASVFDCSLSNRYIRNLDNIKVVSPLKFIISLTVGLLYTHLELQYFASILFIVKNSIYYVINIALPTLHHTYYAML